MNSVDLSKTIAPKSDQLNADDLIAGPMTITITQVRGVDGDQPIAVHFEGDNGKPYKPCKSMRRVLVHAWGKEGREYVGKRMSLYCDPEVAFGGVKVGGIRISHMSHINRPLVIPLTVTRAKRSPYEVKPLKAEVRSGPRAARDDDDRPDEPRQEAPAAGGFPGDFGRDEAPDDGSEVSAAVKWGRDLQEDLEGDRFDTVEALDAFIGNAGNAAMFTALTSENPDYAKRLNAQIVGRRKALASRRG